MRLMISLRRLAVTVSTGRFYLPRTDDEPVAGTRGQVADYPKCIGAKPKTFVGPW
jgi:transposase